MHAARELKQVLVLERHGAGGPAAPDLGREPAAVEGGDGGLQVAGLLPGRRHQLLLCGPHRLRSEACSRTMDRVLVQLGHPVRLRRVRLLRRPGAVLRRGHDRILDRRVVVACPRLDQLADVLLEVPLVSLVPGARLRLERAERARHVEEHRLRSRPDEAGIGDVHRVQAHLGGVAVGLQAPAERLEVARRPGGEAPVVVDGQLDHVAERLVVPGRLQLAAVRLRPAEPARDAAVEGWHEAGDPGAVGKEAPRAEQPRVHLAGPARDRALDRLGLDERVHVRPGPRLREVG